MSRNEKTLSRKSSPSETRRDRERQKTRQKILKAATQLLLKQGVEGFSMRKLAKQIGYTPTAIYFYFPDKEGLLGEVVDGRFKEFRQAFEKIGREPDPIRRLASMGMAFVKFALEHPDHYRFMFLTSLRSIPKGRFLEKGNPSQDCYAFLWTTVQEAMQQGQFRSEFDDVDQVSQIFFAAVHGVMSLHIVKGDDDWVQWSPIRPKAERMIQALIRGLTPERGGSRAKSANGSKSNRASTAANRKPSKLGAARE